MEMTGLEPETCVPLQVAVILTTPELQTLDEIEMTIHQSEDALATMNDFVRRMHTDNGLIEQVRRSEVSLEVCDAALANFLGSRLAAESGILAGNSIHQDRRFLQAYFPLTCRFLHYRMVDVSTIKELVARWYPPGKAFAKQTADHTALADIKESIRELAYYRENFFRDAAGE